MLPEAVRTFLRKRRTRLRSPTVPAILDHGAVPWLLAIALTTTLPHLEHLPAWLSLFSGVLLLGRGWLWRTNTRLPVRWLLALVVIVGTAAIGWHYRTLFGRDAGVALLVFFMALKPMEMHTRRDGLVIIMLGFFLLLTHYFHSQSIPTGLWLLAVATLLTATLIRLHGGTQPIRVIFRYAALLVVQAIPLMLAFFLLFPRVQGPLWGLPQDAHAGLTGLSDRMSPGSLNNLIQSGEIAFRAQFATPLPDRARLYWRGPVFDAYDGQTWRTSPLTASRSANKPATVEPSGTATVDYTMTLEPHNQRWLLALDLPVSLPEGSALWPAFETLAREPVRYRTRYTFRSALDHIANREESPRMLQQALRLPAGLNPRTRELAGGWRTTLNNPEEISAEALRYFREQNFFYTLQPPLLGTNAVDEFLFDTRRGFCEHYASAYVTLMRAAGVPARVVTGYQGGELNPVDGFLTVRQSDAHAWAEIWLDGKGWIRVDPTAAVAPSRIERGIGAALPAGDPLPALVRIDNDWLLQLQRLRYRWEAVNNAWNQWILGYNPQRQREVLSRLGMNDPDWRSMASAMAILSGLCLLCVTIWTLTRRTRVSPDQLAWRRFCRGLERFGVHRANWEGPFDLAERVARDYPDLTEIVREAAGHFADLRYGTGNTAQLHALKDCTRRLASYRRRKV